MAVLRGSCTILGWIALQMILFDPVFATNDLCGKKMSFDTTINSKVLMNHTFKTLTTSDDMTCQSNCFRDSRCISYSFDTFFKTCNLSDSDHIIHPEALVYKPNGVYRRAENDCKCPHSTSTCRVNFVDNTHWCQCKPGFTGSDCSIKIRPCASNPCQNAGACQDTDVSFTCTCAAGYTGAKCSTSICKNGGTYFPGYCSCKGLYLGKYCEIEAEYIQVNTPGSPICFKTKNNGFGVFHIPEQCSVGRFKLKYVSGSGVTHRSDTYDKKYWGSNNIMAVIITDSSDKRISPWLLSDYQSNHYYLHGYTNMSPTIILPQIYPDRNVTAGEEYRIWFGQDLNKFTDYNNEGETCCDVFVLKY